MDEQAEQTVPIGEDAPGPAPEGRSLGGRRGGWLGKLGFYLALLPLVGVLFALLLQPG